MGAGDGEFVIEGDCLNDDFRPLDYWLLLGTYVAPVIFVWFFLRRCYRPSLRRAAFTYAVAVSVLPMIGAFLA